MTPSAATASAVRAPMATDRTFLLGPGVVPAINALLLAPVLYRGRLVPRILPVIGLLGVPLLLTSTAVTLFSTHGQVSGLSFCSGYPSPPGNSHSASG